MKYSNRHLVAFLSAAAAVSVIPSAHALVTAHSVPPASFLDYHVDTVPQLTFEVTYDKVVQKRLAHHFHLTGPAMSAYVHDNLVLQHLRAPLRTRVYCVSPQGREYFVRMTLKTGTPVFALRRTGQPILRLVCGNPLVSSLPPAPKKALAAKPAAKAAAKTLVKSEQLAENAPVATAADTAPAAWSVPTILASSAGQTLFTQAASGSGWYALLPVLGGLVGVITSHHGGNGGGSAAQTVTGTQVSSEQTTLIPSNEVPTTSVPGGPSSTPQDGPAPVPEPGPNWVFALGGLTLGVLRLRRK